MDEIERQINRLQEEESITWYSCGTVEKTMAETGTVSYTLDDATYRYEINIDDTSLHNTQSVLTWSIKFTDFQQSETEVVSTILLQDQCRNPDTTTIQAD